MKYVLILQFLLISFLTDTALANTISCKDLLREKQKTPFSDVPVDLLSHYDKETGSMTVKEIQKLNAQTLNDFTSYRPKKTGSLRESITYKEAEHLLDLMRKELIGPHIDEKYERTECKTGFCFGRAYLSHRMVKNLKVQPDSIRKFWSVGEMQAKNETVKWQFHVATVVYVEGKGWMTLDTVNEKPVSAAQWFSQNIEESTDGRVRIYVTNALKFGVSLGAYDKYEMGFKSTREDDFYHHYFVDHTRHYFFQNPDKLRQADTKTLNPP